MYIVRTLLLALLFVTLNSGSALASEIACLNGPYEKNSRLWESFEKSKDPLRLSYLKSRQSPTSPSAPAPDHCITSSGTQKQLDYLSQLISTIKKQIPSPQNEAKLAKPESAPETSQNTPSAAAKIHTDCIAAAMVRKAGNEGFTCHYPNAKEVAKGFSPDTQSVQKSYGNDSGRTVQCVTQDMADYLSFAVNSAIQCLSPQDPIDSRVIFKKLNNETAFNPSIAWNGGVGIGQITSIAADEIAHKTRGKGRYILENITKSEKPECEGFKNIAEKDLKGRPSILKWNRCEWVSPGNGLARNLIYSIGYYLVMRDHYIKPAVEARSAELLNNQELISDLTAISYGAEGLEHARWLLQKYRVNEKTDSKKLQQQIRKNSKYLVNIKDKMHEVSCLRKGLDPASSACGSSPQDEEDMEANSCVYQ